MHRLPRPASLLRSLLLISLPGLGLGCGLLGSGTDARCDLRPTTDQCTDLRDFKGQSLATFRGLCASLNATSQGGTFQDDARCDMTGVVAGCQTRNGDGSLQTNWYYKGNNYKTDADVQEECENYQTLVPPTP